MEKKLDSIGKSNYFRKNNLFRMKPWKPGGLQRDPGFDIIEINKKVMSKKL
jgi:hypothetical protein